MAAHLVRFDDGGTPRWGVRAGGRVHPLAGSYASTRDLVERGGADRLAAARAEGEGLDAAVLTYLSPVTAPCRVICQGANYAAHMRSSGVDPKAQTFNMFFEKSDASIAPPTGVLAPPAHVRLLDYEAELALVFKREISADTVVTAANLHEYVFGVTIANDVSARDVQLPQTQFFKGKSYRGFCPLGPVLVALEPDDFGALDELEIELRVNGEVRQRDTTGNLVFKPAETITELSTFSDLSPGDVLLTGTPDGCALGVPKPAIRRIVQLLPERLLWRLFLRTQARRPQYLRDGDVVSATIASPDRRIDLGEQRITIASGIRRTAPEPKRAG